MNRYHTFLKRVIAVIIDSVVLCPLALLNINKSEYFTSTVIILFSILLQSFNFIFLHGKYGKTLGKMLLNLKVYDINEVDNIGYKRALFREIIWILPSIFALYIDNWWSSIALLWIIVEILILFFNPKRRAIHDIVASSVVIDLNEQDIQFYKSRH